MKGKLARVLRGEAIKFIKATTKSQSVFVPDAFVDRIVKDMKPGKEAQKTFESLNADTVSGWLVQSGENISEPAEVREWREGMDKDGKDTSVVGLHSLSFQSFESKESNDSIVLDRWMELLGQPYLPRSANELEKLQRNLSDKIGSKYEVFEKRAKEAQKKKEAEKRE